MSGEDSLFRAILNQNPIPTVILTQPGLIISYRNLAAIRLIGTQAKTLSQSSFHLSDQDVVGAIELNKQDNKLERTVRKANHIYRISNHSNDQGTSVIIQLDHVDLVARSRGLFDFLPLIVSQRTETDLFHNKAFFEFTGQNREDPDNVSYINAVHADDRKAFTEVIYGSQIDKDDQSQVLTGPIHVSHVHRLLTAGGEYRWVKTEAVMSAGQRTFLTFDIHEVHLQASRVANQEMLLRLEQQENRRLLDQESVAKEGNRLKGEFLANTSHEIRTPIAGVIGMVDLLLDTELDSEQRDYADSIRSSADALLTVINDVLDFSKIEAGKMQIENLPFELTQVTKDIETMVSFMAAKKSLSFSIDMDPATVLLMGDRGRIRQILLNLLSNAIKFTQKGSVKLSVIKEEEDDQSMKVRFIVKDTGSGMSEETLKNLFKPFAQGDAGRTYGGTGLGLSICKKLIELLHGEIGTDSVLRQGTTFWFWLRFQRASEDQYRGLEGTNDSTSTRRTSRVAATTPNSTKEQKAHFAAKSDDLPRSSSLDLSRENLEAVNKEDGGIRLAAGQAESKWSSQVIRPGTFERTISTSSILTVKPDDDEASSGQTSCQEEDDLAMMQDDNDESFEVTPEAATADTSRVENECAAQIPKAKAPPHLRHAVSPIFSYHESSAEASDDQHESIVTQTSSTQAGKDKKILLAEDNDINCKIAMSMLRKLGYDCTVVKNGQEAVDAIDEQSSFDLILMDVQMPVLNGFEATAKIRKSPNVTMRSIPVIALTASAISGDREKCLAAGMDDYLTKPVNKKQLEKKLIKWLDL